MPAITLPLCVRTDVDDMSSRNCLLKDGWREIERLEVWWRKAGAMEQLYDGVVEMASADAKTTCLWIAATSFSHDRLHKDAKISNDVADRVKMNFVEEAFNSIEKSILVAKHEQHVAGFCILLADETDCAIELIAVHRKYRRQGIGRALIAAAANTYRDLTLVAGTQSTNESGQALYMSCGFECIQTWRSFHK